MLVGTTKRSYDRLWLVNLVLIWIGMSLKSTLLMWASIVAFALTFLLTSGRKVEVSGKGITLTWGYILKREEKIESGDILDVIDAGNAKAVTLARYLPEMALLPITMFLIGAWLSLTGNPQAGLDWAYLGGLLLLPLVFSEMEKKPAIVYILGLSIIFALLSYSYGFRGLSLSLLFYGVFLAFLVRYSGVIGSNFLLLVTRKDVYLLSYGSKEEFRNLLSGGLGR